MQIFDFIINKPIGWILEMLGKLTGGNFAASVFLLTLLINLILIPLSIKSPAQQCEAGAAATQNGHAEKEVWQRQGALQ